MYHTEVSKRIKLQVIKKKKKGCYPAVEYYFYSITRIMLECLLQTQISGPILNPSDYFKLGENPEKSV